MINTEKNAELEKRTNRIHCSFNNEELETIDSYRGKISRAAYLRLASLKNVPNIIPEINTAKWVELSRLASNLNQLTKAYNETQTLDIEICQQLLRDLRNEMIGLKQ